MATIVVVYGTGEGQTARVADRVVATLSDAGHDAEARDVDHLPPSFSPADYDAVVVGGSIHAGKHDPGLLEFVRTNRAVLTARPSALFVVCLSAALPDADGLPEAAAYVEDVRAATGWVPDRAEAFAGALRYSEYGFLERALVRQIAKRTTGDTDTSRDYEYTDWDAVEAFAAGFAALVEGEDGGESTGPDDEQEVAA